jgi:transcriptional repressor NrdR
MKCPRCDSSKMRVIDSREGVDGRSVRRRRECEACEFRFTTFERIEESLPMVVKKGGHRESFDREKVLSGMKRACEKRPVSVLDLEESVKQIETTLLDGGEKEVSSELIGSLVSESLKNLDQVAYVRFASVYREFSDVNEFVETLNQLSLPSQLKRLTKNSENVVLPMNVRPIKGDGRPVRPGKQLTLIENIDKQ